VENQIYLDLDCFLTDQFRAA